MEQAPIRVAVVGASGRMGQETLRALGSDPGFSVVAAISRSRVGENARAVAGPKAPDIVFSNKLGASLDASPADVVVDLSHHSCAATHAESAAKRGAAFVIGCTGLDANDMASLRETCEKHSQPGLVVPNFAVGAVLMMKFSEMASRWMPDAEIIEMHHERKEDAPSGTAMLTLDLIAKARTGEPTKKPRETLKLAGARGAEKNGVNVHSVRMPGFLAHQQVLFGGPGEILTIRHDSTDRVSFMAGVKISVRSVLGRQGLTIGLDKILFAQ